MFVPSRTQATLYAANSKDPFWAILEPVFMVERKTIVWHTDTQDSFGTQRAHSKEHILRACKACIAASWLQEANYFWN